MWSQSSGARAADTWEYSGLDDYQSAVGGLIDAVDLESIGATLFVNDEGLVIGLPFNARATFLWWLHVSAAMNKAMLVGDAVIVGMLDRQGESTDVPDELLHTLTHRGAHSGSASVRRATRCGARARRSSVRTRKP